MADDNKQTAEEKRELKRNEHSEERTKETTELGDHQMAEIGQLLKTRQDEDQAKAQEEQDRSDGRQKANSELAQQDQQNEQEANKQLNELKNKLIERAVERAKQVKEDGARRRADSKYTQRSNKLAGEAERFYHQIIGWRSGFARKVYNASIEAETNFDTENDTYLRQVRGFEDEELANKHATEKAHLVAKRNKEDLEDEAEYKADSTQEEIDGQKTEAQKKAETDKAEIQKQFAGSQTQGADQNSHTAGSNPQQAQAAAAAAQQKQQQDKLTEIDKRLAATIKDLDDKSKGIKTELDSGKEKAKVAFEKEEQRADAAGDKVQHDIDQRRYEAKKEHLKTIKGIKDRLKGQKINFVGEYKAKLKAIYEARRRKPSNRPPRTDQQSAQEGTPQQTYMEIVNQYETPDKPLSLARKNVEATHAYIKKLIGGIPWLERCGVGEVLSVNRNSHRCTVQLGSSPSYDTIDNCTTTTVPVTTTHTVTTTQPIKDANGNVTGFQNVDEEVTTTTNLQETICVPDFTLNDQGHVVLSDVRYGATHPKKGESYTVHIPAVYRDAKTHLDAGRPWIIVPEQSTRFLYRKFRNETIMQRWDWPPPDVGQPWLPEEVHSGLNKDDELVGAITTDDEDGTQIILKHAIPTDEKVEGSHGLERVVSHDLVTQYPGMGFDDGKEPWTPTPPSVRLMASANDSVTTVGQRWTDTYFEDPGVVEVGVGSYSISTALCCLPFPFQVIDPFTGIDVTPQGPFCAANSTYTPIMATITHEPIKHVLVNNVLSYKGKLANISTGLGTYQDQYQTIHGPDETSTGVINNQACGGCHWFYFVILPLLVAWDSCTPNPTYYTGEYRPGRISIYKDWFAEQNSFRIGGAWDDKAATVIFDRKNTKVGKEWNDYSPRNQRLQLYGDFGVRDVTLPGFNEHDQSFDITAMAVQTDDNGNDSLVMIGDLQNYANGTFTRQCYRWQDGTWSLLNGVDFVWDMSRDAMDMLGSDKNGGQVYSLDSGKTWQPCATLPLPGRRPFNSGAVRFIDDCS